jgi:hypothetical protein
MIELNNVTLVCIDTKNKLEALSIMNKMSKLIKFNRCLYFTNGIEKQDNIEIINIPDITASSKKDGSYSSFCIKELPKYITTEFCLIVQHDGFILNPEVWTDDFLKYDYIGAAWPAGGNYVNRVGNGGFSLRSKKFLDACLDIFKDEDIIENEDLLICVLRYDDFIKRGITYAPIELAVKFSIEDLIPEITTMHTFGFHGTSTKIARNATKNNIENLMI